MRRQIKTFVIVSSGLLLAGAVGAGVARADCPAGTDAMLRSSQPAGATWSDTEQYCQLAGGGAKHGPCKLEMTDFTRLTPSTITDGQFDSGMFDGVWTTIDVTGGVIRTCTYDMGVLLSGDAGCPEAVFGFSGTSEGGSLELVLAGTGVTLTLSLTSGMTAQQVVQLVADAIAANATLQSLGVGASVGANRLEVSGSSATLTVAASGITASASAGTVLAAAPPIPTLPRTGQILLLALLGVASAAIVALRRRRAA